MGRQSQKKAEVREQRNAEPPLSYPPHGGGQGLSLATLIVAIGVLMVTFANWRDIDSIEEHLNTKLGAIENRITQLSTKVDNLPKQAANTPQRRGPDPNRKYTINTAGSPAKGPADAPITIAEFSDFQ